MASTTVIGCSYTGNRFTSSLRRRNLVIYALRASYSLGTRCCATTSQYSSYTSLAMGQFLAIRLFGGLVGLTISSAIFNSVFAASISDATIRLTGDLAPLKDASNAVNFIDELRSLDVSFTILEQVLRVYLKCFQAIFYTVTGLSGLGLLTSVFLDEINLKGQALGNQRFEE